MKKYISACPLSIIAVIALAWPTLAQIRTAKVTGGLVEGVIADGVASFKGIPFAAPPVGKLRWKAPQPVIPWTGILKADTFAPACMQDTGIAKMMGAPTNISEDCLYLNVWTAAKKPGEKRAVMVWIYGGAFVGGMTSIPMFDGTKLAQKGVVLVSTAYRVGPFGFLAHPELSRESGRGSGTYGLQDIIAALQWVKKNIAQFGGDASRVTIFGESAGAIAVSMLAASPAAKGLFHRAISQSGGSFAPPRFANEAGQNVPTLKLAEETGKAFLEKLGVQDIEAARRLSAEQIMKGATGAGMLLFWPVCDGYIIPGDQYELYLQERFNDTPILVGTNSDEGAMFARQGVTAATFEKQIREGYGPYAEELLKVYPHATDEQAAKSAKDVFRESAFAWHTWVWARLQSQKGKHKAFVYYFDHRTPTSPDGANHGAEIPYVFRNLTTPGSPPRPEDTALSDLMSSYWVNFAKSGNPNNVGLPLWPPFTEDDQVAMIFNSPSGAGPLPNMDKLKAFDAYYGWRRAEAKAKAGSKK